ncbi:MAG TPA: RNA methyltransferase, partial [Longimicrobiales bacterium]|nr:RNA methyltransferase [Longimicrobiales bacterium]
MLSRAESRLIHALHRRKARETAGFFLAEGVRVAEELVRSSIDLRFAVIATSLEDSARGSALRGALTERCPVHVLPEHELRAQAATESPQGVLIVARVPDTRLADVTPGERSTLLVSDGVQDPGNLGTLIRVADAFAATAVALLPGTVDPWNPKVVRSTAGSAFHLPIVQPAAGELFDWLDARDYRVLGADAAGSNAAELPSAPRSALVLGNEGAGLRAETRARVAQYVMIPMPGRAESLNVSVAAGI